MPWFLTLLLIVAVYLMIMAIKAMRDFIAWYREGRAFVREQQRFKALRRQNRSPGLKVPAALKERSPDSPRPPHREIQPPPP